MKFKYFLIFSLLIICILSMPISFADDSNLSLDADSPILSDANEDMNYLSDDSVDDCLPDGSLGDGLSVDSVDDSLSDGSLGDGLSVDSTISNNGNNLNDDDSNENIDDELIGSSSISDSISDTNPLIYNGTNVNGPDLNTSFVNLRVLFSDANTIFVNASYTGSTESGTQENPYKSINTAITKLTTAKNNLFIAKGVYETNKILSISKSVNIVGENAEETIISGKNYYKLFYVTGINSVVNIFNITLTKSTAFNGSAIYNNMSTVNVVNTIFKENTAKESSSYSGTLFACGATIYNDCGIMKIFNSSFINNNATGEEDSYGGAIYNFLGEMSIFNSSFANNTVDSLYSSGGAIYNYGGSLTVVNSSFNGNSLNSSSSIGGAIASWDSKNVFIFNSTFDGNRIYGDYAFGSAISNKGRLLQVENCTFVNNAAYGIAYDENNTIINVNSIFDYINSVMENNIAGTVEENILLCLEDQNILLKAFDDGEIIDLPSSYDLRDYNLVTPIRDQAGSGSCWAFSTLAALESFLLKGEGIAYDFSENNMKNLMGSYFVNGTDWGPNNGGNYYMSLAYLLRWNGPVNESLDPFVDTSYRPTVITDIEKHVQDVLFIPLRFGNLDNDQIKKAIMTYGALYTSMYADDDFQFTTNYYTQRPSFGNHAVTLVGWDDDFPASNFTVRPPGDGAFIIKNSWGDEYGDDGYWYVSYYDPAFAGIGIDSISAMAFVNVENITNYKDIYQYDALGNTFESLGYNCETAWFANQFTSNSNNPLSAFGFYSFGSSSYLADIYVNGELKYSQEGNVSGAGYHTVKLNQFVELVKNDVFRINIRLTTPGSLFPIAIESKRSGYSSKASANVGQSFVSFDGFRWLDTSKNMDIVKIDEYLMGDYRLNSTNVCLKAYTAYAGDLSLDIFSNATLFIKGDSIEIIYNITNFGDWMEDINLTLRFDEVCEIEMIHSPSKGFFDAEDNVWSIPSLANGETASLKINIILKENKEIVENFADISANGFNNGEKNDSIKLYYSGLTRFITVEDISILSRSCEEVTITLVDALSRPVVGKEIIVSLIGSQNQTPYITDNNGSVKLVFNLTEGFYSYNITFAGDEILDASEALLNVNVSKIVTLLANDTLQNDVISLSLSGDKIIVSLLDEFNNKLANKTVYLNVKELNEDLSLSDVSEESFVTDEDANIELILNLTKGTYVYSLSFIGDEIYRDANLEFNVIINKRDAPYMLTGDKVINSSDAFTVVLVDNNFNILPNKLIKLILVDSKSNTLVYNEMTDEYGVARFIGIPGGIYNASGIFENDDEYEDNSFDSLSLTVLGQATAIEIPFHSKLIDGYANISAKLLDSIGDPIAQRQVELIILNKSYNLTTDAQGLVSINLKLNKSTYHVFAKFIGDDFYLDSNSSGDVYVSGADVITPNHTGNDTFDLQNAIDSANPGDIIYLENYDFVDVSTLDISKDIIIKGSNASITGSSASNIIFDIKEGVEEFAISGIRFILDNADVVVSAIGLNNSNSFGIVNPSIKISENSFDLLDEDVIPESITLVALISENPVLSVSDEIIISNNTLVAGLVPFKFDVIGIHDGQDIYINPEAIVPKKLATVIDYENMTTTAVDVETDGRVGKYFIITLKDSDGKKLAGKPVQIGFNGNVYDRVTDDKGQAKLQINLKGAGTYTFAVSYLGDDEYNGSFVVAKIVVNKQKGSLTVPNKSYKASATSKALTATFKSASGKVVKGKKITFTVNGKSYSATTNAKGVATVNVSLNTKGTYSFTAKFAGNNMYAAISKTATLTIK